MKITVKKATPEMLRELGTDSWPTWTCPVSKFDWSYDDEETCHFHEGEVVVHTADGDVEMRQGDVVSFPKGLKCTWEVKKPVRKVYTFGKTTK